MPLLPDVPVAVALWNESCPSLLSLLLLLVVVARIVVPVAPVVGVASVRIPGHSEA